MSDTVAGAIVILGIACFVALVVFLILKLQSSLASQEVDEIEMKDKDIEKSVNDSSLIDLVNSNNDEKRKSK